MNDLELFQGENLSNTENVCNQVAKALGDNAPSFLDMNYIKLLVHQNQGLNVEYILDFLHMASLTGADPRIKQIYLLSYQKWNPKTNRKELIGTPVFSYHFFLSQANKTGKFRNFNVSSKIEEVFNPISNTTESQLVATAIVYRDGSEPVTFKARWNEVFNDKNPIWKAKPYIMLEKTAIANAVRWAFPEAMSNIFIEGEITPETKEERKVREIENLEKDEIDDLWAKDKTEAQLTPGDPEYIFPIRKFANQVMGEIKAEDLIERCEYMNKLNNRNHKDIDETACIEIYLNSRFEVLEGHDAPNEILIDEMNSIKGYLESLE